MTEPQAEESGESLLLLSGQSAGRPACFSSSLCLSCRAPLSRLCRRPYRRQFQSLPNRFTGAPCAPSSHIPHPFVPIAMWLLPVACCEALEHSTVRYQSGARVPDRVLPAPGRRHSASRWTCSDSPAPASRSPSLCWAKGVASR